MFVLIAAALGRVAWQSFTGGTSAGPTAPAAAAPPVSHPAAANTLLDQSGWWITPLPVIALLFVLAMMECTRTLLAKPAPPRAKPVDSGELRRRLMALSGQAQAYRVVESRPWDLELDWNVIPASWQKRSVPVKITTVYPGCP